MTLFLTRRVLTHDPDFNLFLKSLKNPDGTAVWTTTKLTAIPMGGYAINIALSFGFCYLSDVLRARWIILLCMAVFVGFPALTILSVWNVAVGAKYYACVYSFLRGTE